jgi:hypothetical protein
VRECYVPDRLTASEWVEVLTTDMLQSSHDWSERAIGDFVTPGDVVARSRKRKTKKEINTNDQ